MESAEKQPDASIDNQSNEKQPRAVTHDAKGKFAKGNKLGTGNPHAKKVADHRMAMMNAVTPADTKAVVKKLLEMALAGEGWAAKEYLDRFVGKVKQEVSVEGQTTLKTYLGISIDDV